jgi:NAD(P)-dependent dehydrogenase (short-subunit alcohol dehydrogenase family)
MSEKTVDRLEKYPALQMFCLEGKSAIITGAGSGLGKAVALGFAKSGADVVLADMNAESVEQTKFEIEAMGYKACAVKADVTSSEDAKRITQKTIEEYGKIDILVNCAGITRRMPFEDFDENDWDLVLNVNLKGSFLMSKYTGRAMLQQGKGSIINFGSLGSLVAIPNSAAYCASKGGVAQMTKTSAVEWAKRGVRVNAILPGTFETKLLKQCIDENPGYEQEMLQRFPIGRFAKPEEIVGACVFLASEASTYVIGHLLYVDGGCIAY